MKEKFKHSHIWTVEGVNGDSNKRSVSDILGSKRKGFSSRNVVATALDFFVTSSYLSVFVQAIA